MDLTTTLALDVVQKREVQGCVKKLKRSLGQTRRKNTALSKIWRKDTAIFKFVAAKANELLDDNIALRQQLAEADEEVAKLKEQLAEARDAEEAAEKVVTELKLKALMEQQ